MWLSLLFLALRFAVIASGCASCPRLVCRREGCGAEFCYHCKQAWHPNQTCDSARQQRAQSLHTHSNHSPSYTQEQGPGEYLKNTHTHTHQSASLESDWIISYHGQTQTLCRCVCFLGADVNRQIKSLLAFPPPKYFSHLWDLSASSSVSLCRLSGCWVKLVSRLLLRLPDVPTAGESVQHSTKHETLFISLDSFMTAAPCILSYSILKCHKNKYS